MTEEDKIVFSKKFTSFINGEFIDTKSGKEFSIINPSNEEEICKVQEANEEDVELAYKAAKKAFKNESRRNMSFEDRKNILFKIAGNILIIFSDLFDKNAYELARLETLNNGSPFLLQKAIISGLSHEFRYNAGMLDKLDQKVIETGDTTFSFTKRVCLNFLIF
jgi:aldehyde dehydrogenase (NAD+)